MPREVVVLQTGQCGIGIGNACWELFCLEHGIRPDGAPSEEFFDQDNAAFSTFFLETGKGAYVPRCVYMDTEPTCIQEIKAGPYKGLYSPEQFVEHPGGSDGGTIMHGRHAPIQDEAQDRIRKQAEECDELQGFLLCNSGAGGTGAGFTSWIMEHCGVNYPAKTLVDFCVMPSPKSAESVIGPYTCTQFTEYLLEHADLCYVFDNQAAFGVAKRCLHTPAPTFTHVNRIIAQVMSSATTSMRFQGTLGCDLREMVCNLVPFPRMHFVLPSFAPLVPAEKEYGERLSTGDITNAAFEPAMTLATCDPRHGQYIAISAMYRGDVVLKEMSDSLASIKKRPTIKFVDWSPKGVKGSISYQPACTVPDSGLGRTDRSLLLAATTTAIAELFTAIHRKADILYVRAFSFMTHFEDAGYEQGQMMQALRRLADLQRDYEQIGVEDEAVEEGEEEED